MRIKGVNQAHFFTLPDDIMITQ